VGSILINSSKKENAVQIRMAFFCLGLSKEKIIFGGGGGGA
jgi:hypothetical protein